MAISAASHTFCFLNTQCIYRRWTIELLFFERRGTSTSNRRGASTSLLSNIDILYTFFRIVGESDARHISLPSLTRKPPFSDHVGVLHAASRFLFPTKGQRHGKRVYCNSESPTRVFGVMARSFPRTTCSATKYVRVCLGTQVVNLNTAVPVCGAGALCICAADLALLVPFETSRKASITAQITLILICQFTGTRGLSIRVRYSTVASYQ